MSVAASELKRFRAEKDRVFAGDPHSPLTQDQRDGFRGLATGQLDADGARERFAAALLATGFDSGEPR